MKIESLIKNLETVKKKHGNIEVIMNIFDTNTSKEWDHEDEPYLIGIRSTLTVEPMQFLDMDTNQLTKKEPVVFLKPDYEA